MHTGMFCPVGASSPVICPSGSYCPAAATAPTVCSGSYIAAKSLNECSGYGTMTKRAHLHSLLESVLDACRPLLTGSSPRVLSEHAYMLLIHICGFDLFDRAAALTVVTTLAGGLSGSNCAFADGPGSNAGFCHPQNLVVDVSNNIFVGDPGNLRIRKVSAAGGTSP
jgi:hypothetical protein